MSNVGHTSGEYVKHLLISFKPFILYSTEHTQQRVIKEPKLKESAETHHIERDDGEIMGREREICVETEPLNSYCGALES